MSFTLTWKPKDGPNESDKIWMHALGEVLDRIEPSHYAILSTLTLLSNSLFSCQSLPPLKPLLEPHRLTHQLLKIDGIRTRHGSFEDLSMPRNNNHDFNVPGDVSRLNMEVRQVLDVKNMEQRGYAEFAILRVCNALVCDDLRGLITSISGLVGIVDFSFRVNESNSSLGTSEADQAVLVKQHGPKGKGKAD